MSCPGKFRKILKILLGILKKILKKQKVNFEEIFWIKKCIKFKLIRNSLFAPKRDSHSRLLSASYLSLVYFRATARVIREETIFVDASSGRLPFTHRNGSHQLYLLHISMLKFIRKGLLCRSFHKSEGAFQKIFFR